MIQAIVLAAGISTRMRPLTNNVPKPMLELAGKPILHYVIENLRNAGIEHIIITTHYLPLVIRDYFGNGSQLNVKITYSYEENLLDTAGSLKKLESLLEDNFLVCGGHFILPTIDFNSLIEFHHSMSGIGTIVFKRLDELENLKFFGQGIFDDEERLIYFVEKPKEAISRNIHTTYQIFNKRVLKYIPKNRPVSIPDFLIPRLLSDGESLYGHFTDSELINVSTIELYKRAQEKIERM
ncbi:MAG: nucleotidyltransferase family protein [Patescibacteria group bacterium]|jgi:NDP-sugar pyrophosphorylase family protein